MDKEESNNKIMKIEITPSGHLHYTANETFPQAVRFTTHNYRYRTHKL